MVVATRNEFAYKAFSEIRVFPLMRMPMRCVVYSGAVLCM